jgi:hypothetical protein
MMDKFLQLLEKLLAFGELTVQILWGKSHQVWNWLEGKAEWLKKRGLDEYRFLRRYLMWLAIIPAALVALGIIGGFIGFHADWLKLIPIAQSFIALGGVLFFLGSLFIALRMAVIAELLVLAGRALSQVPRFFSRSEPTVIVSDQSTDSQESVKRLLRGLMGVLFFLGVLSLYCCYFPVYASITGFLVVLTIALTLGFGTYYFKWMTVWTERVSLAAILFMLLVTSLNFAQVVLRQKAIESDIRMQKIYAAEYERISLEREALLRYDPTKKATSGIRAEDTPEYKIKTWELNKVRAKMKPATVTEIWDWGWAKVWMAGGWSKDQADGLYTKLKAGLKQGKPFQPDPLTKGTMPDYMQPPVSPAAPELLVIEPVEPEPSEPKYSDEEKAQAKAALEALNKLETEIKNL